VNIAQPTHGNLECWSKQGVLMLNAVLTVRKGDANSHQKKGYVDGLLCWV
jgi:uracil-DNA glycosylase